MMSEEALFEQLADLRHWERQGDKDSMANKVLLAKIDDLEQVLGL